MTDNSRNMKKGDYLLFDHIAKFEDGTIFDTVLKEKAIEAGIYDKEKEYIHLFRVHTGQAIKGIEGSYGDGSSKYLQSGPAK